LKSNTCIYTTYDSPIGMMTIAAADAGIVSLRFTGESAASGQAIGRRRDDASLADVRGQLSAYFAGELTDFDLPIGLEGTPFQMRAWEALRCVPYAETVSYAGLARAIDAPRASRAIGMAMNRNPIALIVPCHRVVGSDGNLRGYAYGLDAKRKLLAFESCCRAEGPVSWERFEAGPRDPVRTAALSG
jgi:methylated-DNA-[protein]-cysteine S-methyltransferase